MNQPHNYIMFSKLQKDILFEVLTFVPAATMCNVVQRCFSLALLCKYMAYYTRMTRANIKWREDTYHQILYQEMCKYKVCA